MKERMALLTYVKRGRGHAHAQGRASNRAQNGFGLKDSDDCIRAAVEFMAGQKVARHGTWKPATETSLLGVWKQLSSNLSSLPAQLDRHLDKMKNKGCETP